MVDARIGSVNPEHRVSLNLHHDPLHYCKDVHFGEIDATYLGIGNWNGYAMVCMECNACFSRWWFHLREDRVNHWMCKKIGDRCT